MSSHIDPDQRVEEGRCRAGIIRNKRDTVLKGLLKINEIMETEVLLKELTQEVSSARELIVECEKKIAEMAPRLDGKAGYYDVLTDEVKHLEEELSPLEREVEEFDARLKRQEQREREVESLKKRVTHLENEVIHFDRSIKELEPQVKMMKEEMPDRKSHLLSERGRLSEIKADVEEQAAAVEILVERVDGEDSLPGLRVELSKIKESNSRVEEIILALKASIEKNGKLEETLSSEVEEKEKRLSEVTELVENLTGEVAAAKQSQEGLDNPEELQIELTTREGEIESLKERCQAIEGEIEEHVRHKGSILEELDTVQAELARARSRFEELETLVVPYEENPEKLESLKRKRSGLDQTLEECKEKLAPLEEELKHLNRARDLLKTEHDGYSEAMSEIEVLLK